MVELKISQSDIIFEATKPTKKHNAERRHTAPFAGNPRTLLKSQLSKDTLDIDTKCQNAALKSCILISKQDGTGEKIAVRKAKSVHFADSLGKPLKSVRTLLDPSDDIFGLNFLNLRSSTKRSFSANIFQQKKEQVGLIQEECKLLNFKQPLDSTFFQARLDNEKVCLKKVFFRHTGIFGTVCVKNICFEKSVTVRYTMDSWKTQDTEYGKYISSSRDGNVDTFSFEILAKQGYQDEMNIMFAICFTASETTYWDSNFGHNYSVLFVNGTTHSEKSVKNNGFILPKQNFIGWST